MKNGEDSEEYTADWENPSLRGASTPTHFFIFDGKKRTFVIPRRCLDEERMDALAVLLEKELDGRFRRLKKDRQVIGL